MSIKKVNAIWPNDGKKRSNFDDNNKKNSIGLQGKKIQTHTIRHRMEKKISSSQMNAKKCVKPAII